MTRAERLRMTLANPEIEARRKAAAASGNGRKLLKFCPKRGFAVPAEKLDAYRLLVRKQGTPAREAATMLGIV